MREGMTNRTGTTKERGSMQTRAKADAEAGVAESGMVIERRFTTAGDDPFDAFE